jgi:hypothetical protein
VDFLFCEYEKAFTIFTVILRNFYIFSADRKFETILNDKISIRAIEIYDNKVWYSGTDSKFGYVDLKIQPIRNRLNYRKEIAVPYFGTG